MTSLVSKLSIEETHFSSEKSVPDQLATLIYSANSGYYNLFSPELNNLLPSIKSQLAEPLSEIGSIYCINDDKGHILGEYTCYDLAEMNNRQLVSLKSLLTINSLNKTIKQNLIAFKSQLVAIEYPSLYLSNIAVTPERKKMGIGSEALLHFHHTAKTKGFGFVSLHVNRENLSAIKFYIKMGYQIQANSRDFEYLSMYAKLDPS